MKVIVIGGADSLIRGNLGRKLAEHNVDIGWHEGSASGSGLGELPKQCEGVIIIRDMCSHRLSGAARGLAQKRNLPVAIIPRKFAKAEAILRAHGFLPASAKTSTTGPKFPTAEMLEVGLSFVCEERRRGRVPKRAEVESVLQRGYGSQVELAADMYKVIHSQASAQVRLPAPEAPPESLPEIQARASEWAALLIEERPERVCDCAKLSQLVRDNVGEGAARIGAGKLVTLINVAHGLLRTRWAGAVANSKGMEHRNDQIGQWLARWYQAFIKNEDIYPTQSQIRNRSVFIFGVQARWALAVEQRAVAFGEWARKLVPATQVYKLHAEHLGSVDKFKALLDSGEIKALRPGNRIWLTSDEAVKQYLLFAASPKTVVNGVPAEPSRPVVQRKGQPVDGEIPTKQVLDMAAEAERYVKVVTHPNKVATDTPAIRTSSRPVAPKISAEEVALAVGELVETAILKQMEALFAPLIATVRDLSAEVAALKAQTTELAVQGANTEHLVGLVHKTNGLAGPQFDKRDAALNGRLDEMNVNLRQHREAMTGYLTSQKLGLRLDTLDGRLAGHTKTIATLGEKMASAKGASSTGGDGMSLRALAELAKETGLRVSIQAGDLNS